MNERTDLQNDPLALTERAVLASQFHKPSRDPAQKKVSQAERDKTQSDVGNKADGAGAEAGDNNGQILVDHVKLLRGAASVETAGIGVGAVATEQSVVGRGARHGRRSPAQRIIVVGVAVLELGARAVLLIVGFGFEGNVVDIEIDGAVVGEGPSVAGKVGGGARQVVLVIVNSISALVVVGVVCEAGGRVGAAAAVGES